MEDNARKFITERIALDFLEGNKAKSFELTVDWLETNEDNEKKLVFKKWDSGEIQIFLVAKVTNNGNRITDKKKITEDEYKKLLSSSTVHLRKKRYEFDFVQNEVSFSLKYDEFDGGKLFMLEVDASTEEERKRFDESIFPIKLSEVTGDMCYYGYRIVEVI